MRRLAAAFCLLLILASSLVPAYAHPGDTDENGGHYDTSTGEYHYHHGYPAHQHTDLDGDGIPDCPYDFDDRTGWNSGTTGKSSSSKSSSSKSRVNVPAILGLLFGAVIIVGFPIASLIANRSHPGKKSLPPSPVPAPISKEEREALLRFIYSCYNEAFREIFAGRRNPYTKSPIDNEILFRIYAAMYRSRHGRPPELPELQDKLDLVDSRKSRLQEDLAEARRLRDAGVTNLLHLPDDLPVLPD